MAREYIDTIAWLYSDLVTERGMRIKDFYDLTMATVNEELKLRTKIIADTTNRRVYQREKKAKAKEKEMMERMKQLNPLT